MSDAGPHPDRIAPTLAVRRLLLETVGDGPFVSPGPASPRPASPRPASPRPGSADARVDLGLLLYRTRRALAERGTAAARARFAEVDSPDLLAGTIQDGTARGVMVALEEAISLCEGEAPPRPEDVPDEDEAAVFEGRDLRRKKDVLVASGGARIRWSRKGGVLFVDREHGVHVEDCVRFEERRDLGDLDGFLGDLDERPRLFSPGFLPAAVLAQGKLRDRLVLEGRLGRSARGFPCRITFVGRRDEPFVRMIVQVRNDRDDHRLRVRFLSCDQPAAIDSDGTPGFSTVHHRGKTFVAATLVRACGRLRVGEEWIEVAGAQSHGWHRHEFRLGGKPWRDAREAD